MMRVRPVLPLLFFATIVRCGREQITVTDPYFGDYEREYLEFLPSSYTPDGEPYPLILDFHGWWGSAEGHIQDSLWDVVGEEEGLIIIVPEGIPDSPQGIKTWNITKEYDEEYGWRCDPDRTQWWVADCHESCKEWCNPEYGCTAGTTCYNDQAFIEQLIQFLQTKYNVDSNHIHISGHSNGGTFTWRMWSYSTLNLGASGPNAGSPFIGAGEVPMPPRSLIDFHGLDDGTVPRLYENSYGEGPMGVVRTILSGDALYYYYKPEYLNYVADKYSCNDWSAYPTSMDGTDGWECQVRSGCINEVEIVMCGGNYGHHYPFDKGDNKAEAARIMWQFFKAHPYVPESKQI